MVMFNFFIKNKLISSNWYRYRLINSCINKLQSITPEIYESFDVGPKVKSVVLGISKAFDEVRHGGMVSSRN